MYSICPLIKKIPGTPISCRRLVIYTIRWGVGREGKNKLFAIKSNSVSLEDSVHANFSSLSEIFPLHKGSPSQDEGLRTRSLGVLKASGKGSSLASCFSCHNVFSCWLWALVSFPAAITCAAGRAQGRFWLGKDCGDSRRGGLIRTLAVWLGLPGHCDPVQGPDWQVTHQNPEWPSVGFCVLPLLGYWEIEVSLPHHAEDKCD